MKIFFPTIKFRRVQSRVRRQNLAGRHLDMPLRRDTPWQWPKSCRLPQSCSHNPFADHLRPAWNCPSKLRRATAGEALWLAVDAADFAELLKWSFKINSLSVLPFPVNFLHLRGEFFQIVRAGVVAAAAGWFSLSLKSLICFSSASRRLSCASCASRGGPESGRTTCRVAAAWRRPARARRKP